MNIALNLAFLTPGTHGGFDVYARRLAEAQCLAREESGRCSAGEGTPNGGGDGVDPPEHPSVLLEEVVVRVEAGVDDVEGDVDRKRLGGSARMLELVPPALVAEADDPGVLRDVGDAANAPEGIERPRPGGRRMPRRGSGARQERSGALGSVHLLQPLPTSH